MTRLFAGLNVNCVILDQGSNNHKMFCKPLAVNGNSPFFYHDDKKKTKIQENNLNEWKVCSDDARDVYVCILGLKTFRITTTVLGLSRILLCHITNYFYMGSDLKNL